MTQPVAPIGPSGAPTCPRHPDRVSRLACQRCGRPTCASCQRPAPVGFHCVDCVAEAARTTPTHRSGLGGVATQARPAVTLTLVGLCVAVYLLQLTTPVATDLGYFSPVAGRVEPWRFLTAAFLHDPSQLMHILFNMLCLWQMGQWLEPLLGRARFAALYLLSGIGGSVMFLLLAAPPTGGIPQSPTAWTQGTLGASGAVFGLFGAAVVLLRHLRRPLGVMLGLLAVNAALPLFVPNIAWQAHLGGFVTGAALAGVLIATRTRPRRRLQWPGFVLVAAVLVGSAVVRYATVPILGLS